MRASTSSRSTTGARAFQDDVDRVVVDLLDFLDALRGRGQIGRRRHGAREREHHVVGGEWRAIVKFDALAQFEAQLRGRHEVPLGGQRGRDLVLLVVANQALVHHLLVGKRGLVVLPGGVECEDVVGAGDAQRGGVRKAGGGQCSHGQGAAGKVHASHRNSFSTKVGKGRCYIKLAPGAPVFLPPPRVRWWRSSRIACVAEFRSKRPAALGRQARGAMKNKARRSEPYQGCAQLGADVS